MGVNELLSGAAPALVLKTTRLPSAIEVFEATPSEGSTTVLTGSANDITAEASLGRMYDEGRKAGIEAARDERRRLWHTREMQVRKKARDEGIEEGRQLERERRLAKKIRRAAKQELAK